MAAKNNAMIRGSATAVLAAVFAAVSMTSAAAASGPSSSGTMVEAVGTGYASALPDQMKFTVCVDTQAPAASAALKANNTIASKVGATLSKDGIAKTDTVTTVFSINPVDDYGMQAVAHPRIVGYHVENCVESTLRDLSEDGKVLDDVAAAVGNAGEISSVQFGLSDPAPLEQSARDDAYADADAKVMQDAQNAGMKVCVPDTVTDNGAPTAFRPVVPGSDPTQQVPLSGGRITVQVTVSVAERCF